MKITQRLREWAGQYETDRSAPLADAAALMQQAADEIERLRGLLLTALALHGGEAHTYSEKEWRAEARAALGIKSRERPTRPHRERHHAHSALPRRGR